MEQRAVIASTHVDRHNMRMTKEALDSAVDQIDGDTVPRLSIEHDVTLPPIGKVIKASVERMEDGEYRLVATQEIFEDFKEVWLPDGTLAMIQESKTDQRPFNGEDTLPPEKIEIHYDPINFHTKDDLTKFLTEVREMGDFKECEIMRKAYLPDPQLIFTLTSGIIAYLSGQKILEKVGDKILEPIFEDFGKLYPLVKTATAGVLRHAVPKNRPVTYVFVAPGQPTIEFVVRTNSPDIVLSAILEQELVESFSKAEELNKTLHAEKVQFLLDSDGRWKFNYLLTDKGAVIGTPEAYSKRAKVLDLMGRRNENSNEER